MGICCSRTNEPPSSSSSSSSAKIINDPPISPNPQDLNESEIKSQKTEPEQQEIENRTVLRTDEEENPRLEDDGKVKKEVSISKHRKSHERSKTSDSSISKHRKSHERSKTSDPKVEAEEKLSEDDKIKSQLNPNSIVRTSSCTKGEVDAILIQCGRLSRNNSPAATKITRRYSGSKRSFDFDQNEKSIGGETNTTADLEEEEDRRVRRPTNRQNHSPRERRRRAPSREREEMKNQRSGSRERENGGSSSRRVSRSPGRRSENNHGSNGGGGSIVISGNTRATKKMVPVPATDKSCKNIAEQRKRNSASPRSQSPASGNSGPPATLSRSSSRKREQSPYRRNPLEEIDQNANKTGPGSTKGISNKKTAEFTDQKANSGSNKNSRVAPASSTNCRAASPSRPTRQHQEVVEEPEIPGTEDKFFPKPPQSLTRSRSARKSRDFDIKSPEEEAIVSSSSNKNNNPGGVSSSSYTALLLEDIQNFHQKNANVQFTVPQCVTNACSIVDAVADLNSTTSAKTPPLPDQTGKNDLMEPSFEKYSVEEIEEQESYGSSSFTGSSLNNNPSSSSWELNSADSTDRWSSRSSNNIRFQRNDGNLTKIQFDPLQNGIGRGRDGSGKSGQTTVMPPHQVVLNQSNN